MKPTIKDAPGHIVRQMGKTWEVRWQARTDIINAGYKIKSQRIWAGTGRPTETEAAYISSQCQRLQDEMLAFSRDVMPAKFAYVFDGTVRSLANLYQTDPDSPYHKKEWAVRRNHDTLLRRIVERHGDELLCDIKVRVLNAWHDEWSDSGAKLPTGTAVMGRLGELFRFGADYLEDPECDRLCSVKRRMRLPHAKPRKSILTAAQAISHREVSRKVGYFSVALADAMQFDLTMRQKDVVGEYVPLSEPGVSDIVHEGKKWIKGARWEEIDEHFIFRHITSKKKKPLEADLNFAPMVMEELSILANVPIPLLRREMLPASGPIIVSESKQRPWQAQSFRQRWRKLANIVGIPKDVKSMDARAGAITEAVDAGASLEDIRHAATHSDISMTQRYSRDSAGKTAKVMRLRVELRKNKTGSDD